MNRNERLHALTEYLRRRRTPVTVADLARRFEIGERSVYRDLAALRAQQVPILGEPGRGGGIMLDPGYALPPIRLTLDEALGLWLSYRLGSLAGLAPVGQDVASAVDKILSAMPPERRREVRAVLQRVVVGRGASAASAATTSPLDAGVLRACSRAFARGCRLSFRYTDRHGAVTRRTVEPHGLLLQPPLWYVLAMDPLRAAPRMFRLDRMRGVAVLEGSPFAPRDPRALFEEIVKLGIERKE